MECCGIIMVCPLMVSIKYHLIRWKEFFDAELDYNTPSIVLDTVEQNK